MTVLPDANHIARYVKGTHFDDGRISGQAFRLRKDREEKYLSVNWLEKLCQSDRDTQMDSLRGLYSKNKQFTLRASARFSVLQTGELCSYVKENSPESIRLVVKHKPSRTDQSHAGICGIPLDDEFMIAELIAELANKREIQPAVP